MDDLQNNEQDCGGNENSQDNKTVIKKVRSNVNPLAKRSFKFSIIWAMKKSPVTRYHMKSSQLVEEKVTFFVESIRKVNELKASNNLYSNYFMEKTKEKHPQCDVRNYFENCINCS